MNRADCQSSSQLSTGDPFAALEARVWACLHAIAVVLHCWRAVVALSSTPTGPSAPAALWWRQHVDPVLSSTARPSFGFVRVQMLLYAFYYAPFHAWAAYELLTSTPGAASRALVLWSTVVAGGYAQAQATSFGAATLQWSGFGPMDALPQPRGSWTLASALAVLPMAFAASCWRRASSPRD